MKEFLTVLGAVVPVLALALAGLGIRKLNWLTEEADHSLLKVNINLLMPCLILDAALGNPAMSQVGNLLMAPAFGLVTVVFGILLAKLVASWIGLRNPAAARTFAVCVGIYNYGYVPVPLALLLFDKQTAAVVFLLSIGVESMMWTLGVMTLSGAGFRQSWRRIINPPMLAILLALVLNLTGLAGYVPEMVHTGLRLLGQCAIPMALILIGAVIADHLPEFSSASGGRVIGAAVVLRLAFLPFLFLLAARFLPASLELKRVMVLEAAMPAAVFPIVMSRHYSGDPPTAMRVVIGTTAVGLVTIPLWIRFGMHWLGLGS